jgi:hypothetical protein
MKSIFIGTRIEAFKILEKHSLLQYVITDKFLEKTNSRGIMTRPIWRLINKLPMFKKAYCGDLKNSHWLEERIVNILSSVKL